MALLQDLIQQIDDPVLRDRIMKETDKLVKQKKFGLVFEEHLPECTPLYNMEIRVGSKVAKKNGYVNDIYIVLKIEDEKLTCESRDTHEQIAFNVDDMVVVAEFGEPIYPTLKYIDSVENAPDSDLWHTLIEADNYHALQLLEYLYAGKVDCIYIDPPYNTGAKDWKYNNDYVDGSDAYRHSKWLSFMKKRLTIAKRLLNPDDSTLIVTIDEFEYNHLGMLLEETFPEAKIQMISIMINPKGRATNYFTRTDEYVYFVFFGKASVSPMLITSDETEVRWPYLKRSDSDSTRGHRPRQFYPIYINDSTRKIEKIGEPISSDVDRFSVEKIDGCTTVFPVNADGTEMEWGLTRQPLEILNHRGFVRVGKKRKNNPMPYSISYLSTADVTRLDNGELKLKGEREDGTKIVVSENGKSSRMQTIWISGKYDAGAYGKTVLGNMLKDRKFPFPKSLYSVHDCLMHITKEKKNAIIVDFFAGSGTTLHAVNLLNAEDGGKRRCILVTNNEVSIDESKRLLEEGHKPGDKEWDELGIARYITWPRTVCSIKGVDINGKALEGKYLDSEISMNSELKTNVAFYKLSFLDKTSIALGRQFKELLPVLWMKANAVGRCPELKTNDIPDMMILPENKMAILNDEIYYSEFDAELQKHSEIKTIFIVTDSESVYREMIRHYDDKDCYQLYRDYLDNFRINTGR